MTTRSDVRAWNDVLATALIGTDRRPTGSDNPAVDILDLAASWTPYRRAGVRAATMDEPPPAAPPETMPQVGQAATVRLELLLEAGPLPWESATRELILAEWLGLAADSGLRVTPHLLPSLLDQGAATPRAPTAHRHGRRRPRPLARRPEPGLAVPTARRPVDPQWMHPTTPNVGRPGPAPSGSVTCGGCAGLTRPRHESSWSGSGPR